MALIRIRASPDASSVKSLSHCQGQKIWPHVRPIFRTTNNYKWAKKYFQSEISKSIEGGKGAFNSNSILRSNRAPPKSHITHDFPLRCMSSIRISRSLIAYRNHACSSRWSASRKSWRTGRNGLRDSAPPLHPTRPTNPHSSCSSRSSGSARSLQLI